MLTSSEDFPSKIFSYIRPYFKYDRYVASIANLLKNNKINAIVSEIYIFLNNNNLQKLAT
jgi:hypothetical protein